MSDELQDRLDTLENEYEALTQDIDTLKSERDEAEARAEAAEQQAARLRAALQAAKAFDDHRLHCRDDICWKRAGLWQAQRKMAVEALAASQPAPAAEFTAQELDDIISGTLTVPRSVVERAMRQRGGQAEGEG